MTAVLDNPLAVCPYQCEDGYYIVPGHGGGQYPCPRCRPFESAQVRKTMMIVVGVCGAVFALGIIGLVAFS